MNRALMDRQMFKMGGVAKSDFPDLSGDGKVTQKDILMGRGVISKQEGGMIPADPMMMPAEQPMMMPPEAGAEAAVPAALEQVFGQMQMQMDGLDNAEDLESMMNAVRGDQQPIEARRAELAEFVGPDDAQQTPESVLALVQPVMQLASVDQGIGSLAAEEMMDTPVEGPMAEGIMSTVNMAPEMPMEVGNQPPVNFRQGGAVQYFADANPQRVVLPVNMAQNSLNIPQVPTLTSAFEDRLPLYKKLAGDPTKLDASLLKEQQDLTKAQMYFDIANTALAFATPGSRQMSPAERLAEAARETQLLDKIGARSQQVQDLKREQDRARRSQEFNLNVAALGAAEKDVAAKLAAQQAAEIARFKTIPTGYINMGVQGDPTTMINVPERLQPLFANLGLVEYGKASQSADSIPKPINFKDQTTGAITSILPNDPKYQDFINDPNQVYTGAASQTKDTTQYGNFFNTVTGVTHIFDTKNRQQIEQLDQLVADNPEGSIVVAGSYKIGKNPKLTDQQRILSDTKALTAYGNNTLDPQSVAIIESAIADEYQQKKIIDSEGQITYQAKTPPNLIVSNYRKRQKLAETDSEVKVSDFNALFPKKKKPNEVTQDFLDAGRGDSETTEGEDGVTITAQEITDRPTENTAKVNYVLDYVKNTGKKVPLSISSTKEFKNLLFDDSGAVNSDSPMWRVLPTEIYDEKVPYGEIRGLGSVPERFLSNIAEVTRELSFTDRVSPETLSKFKAITDLDSLLTQSQGLILQSVTDDRPLKSVQDQILATLEPIRQGVFQFDANAIAAMQSIRGQLELLYGSNAQALPEYLGEYSPVVDPKGQAKIRRNQIRLEKLIPEFIAFEDSLNYYLQGQQAGTTKIGQSDRSMLEKLREQETQGNK